MAHHRLHGFVLSVPLLLLVGIGQASAQVAPTPPAESAHSGSTAGDNTLKQEEGVRGENRATDSQPAAAPPSIRDETVGLGGSVERVPRDSDSLDRAPRDIREPFDE